jgi:hypothetical protein
MFEAEKELGGRANFGEVDVDRDMELVKSVRLLNVPTVGYYRDGQLVTDPQLEVSIESLGLSITVVQFLFVVFTSFFHKICNRLKARVVIYAYRHHVRLLSPEPVVVTQPQSTRVEEPTLLRHQVDSLCSY